MRYVKEHKVQTRQRIVESASYGLRQKGADGLSVVDLMKLAGLTHGGFYSHFDSREALVTEAISFAMDRTITRWADLIEGVPAEERLAVIIASYLTSRHRDDPERGCALPALGADVGRSSSKTRRAFAQNLERMIELVAGQLPGDTPQGAREVATGAIATMVGSIVLARAVGNGELSDRILAAGRGAAARQATVRRARRKTGNSAS